jgi:hypothetical protein
MDSNGRDEEGKERAWNVTKLSSQRAEEYVY